MCDDPNLSELPRTNGDIFYWSAISRYNVAACRLVDPGLYAVIGSAAFMGGSGRITLFLATVLLELTNDIRLVAPIGVVTLVSMLVGNWYNHGLYHGLVSLLDIPFLNTNPSPITRITPVRWIMATPVSSVRSEMTKSEIEAVLEGNRHNGFPVTLHGGELAGLMSRRSLVRCIRHIERDCNDDPHHTVSMAQFMDLSPLSVHGHTKVYRAHTLFVSLGLRHLCVVDEFNKLIGIVTRDGRRTPSDQRV
jgi:chloride channel 7